MVEEADSGEEEVVAFSLLVEAVRLEVERVLSLVFLAPVEVVVVDLSSISFHLDDGYSNSMFIIAQCGVIEYNILINVINEKSLAVIKIILIKLKSYIKFLVKH